MGQIGIGIGVPFGRRRAGIAPNDPSISASLKRWFKADAITGLADSDPVTTWTDSSGTANVTQATAAKKPTYRTNVINSLPVVRFDGTDDLLTGLTTGLSGSSGALYVVFRGVALSGVGCLFGFADEASATRYIM